MTAVTDGATAAAALVGIDLEGGWRVLNRIPKGPGDTGGHFSESYEVEHEGGAQGFLKAFDYSVALSQPNTAATLQALTAAYLFEVGILEECAQARMSRVVLALAHGEVDVPGFGVLSRVNYLIFEKAERDVRRHLDLFTTLEIAWALRSLHHVATGMFQLHGRGISHQDVKPSNVLVFSDETSKIGDLGRANKPGQVSPFDALVIAGDRTYAPPELLYGARVPDDALRRRACDMYHLGSMALFLFAGVGTTGALAARLDPSHLWLTWGDSYEAVLPYVVDAFDRVATSFEQGLPDRLKQRLGQAYRDLCYPDPDLRGDSRNRRGTLQQYSLERYVSRFDLMARDAEIRLSTSGEK
jgi:serine/threonine protein kinase